MRGYTAGLGVQCNYCHVQEGRGGRNDFATDEKAPKKTARVMITMMNHVNETLGVGSREARGRHHQGAVRHVPSRRSDSQESAAATTGCGAGRPGGSAGTVAVVNSELRIQNEELLRLSILF